MSQEIASYQLYRNQTSTAGICTSDAGDLLTVTAPGAGLFVFDVRQQVRCAVVLQ